MKLIKVLMKKTIPRRGSEAVQAEKAEDEMPTDDKAAELNSDERLRRLKLLTPRERELFLLLLEGYSLKKSAELLSVKYSTANTHMTAVYKKLNVKSRAELIIRYREVGPTS